MSNIAILRDVDPYSVYENMEIFEQERVLSYNLLATARRSSPNEKNIFL